MEREVDIGNVDVEKVASIRDVGASTRIEARRRQRVDEVDGEPPLLTSVRCLSEGESVSFDGSPVPVLCCVDEAKGHTLTGRELSYIRLRTCCDVDRDPGRHIPKHPKQECQDLVRCPLEGLQCPGNVLQEGIAEDPKRCVRVAPQLIGELSVSPHRPRALVSKGHTTYSIYGIGLVAHRGQRGQRGQLTMRHGAEEGHKEVRLPFLPQRQNMSSTVSLLERHDVVTQSHLALCNVKNQNCPTVPRAARVDR